MLPKQGSYFAYAAGTVGYVHIQVVIWKQYLTLQAGKAVPKSLCPAEKIFYFFHPAIIQIFTKCV